MIILNGNFTDVHEIPLIIIIIIIIIIIVIIIIIIIIIKCNWVVTLWQWLFYMYTKHDRTMALGSTQPLTEMSTRSISWG